MDQVVEEYLRLTEEIKVLTDRRKLLQPKLGDGRNYGTWADIRVNRSFTNKIDMMLLRKYVTPAIIDLCTVTRYHNSVAVVPKLKPKKPKKEPNDTRRN